MTYFTQSLLGITLLFGCVHLGGYLSLQLGSNRLLGQLIVAILFGPTLINLNQYSWFALSQSQQFFQQLTSVTILLLALHLGLQIQLEKPQRENPSGIILGLLSTLMPFALCSILLWMYKFSFAQALMIGTIAASLNHNGELLSSYSKRFSLKQNTIIRQGQQFGILAVIGLLALSIFVQNGHHLSIITILQGLLFSLGMILLSWFNLPKLFGRIESNSNTIAGLIILLILSSLFAWFSEQIGLIGPVCGVFLVAIIAARSQHQHQLQQQSQFLAQSFVVPLLCIQLGLVSDLRQAFQDEFFGVTVLVIVLALLGRFIVGFVVPRAYQYTPAESKQIASAILARGEFALLIALLASSIYQLSAGLLASSILLVIISLLVSKPLLQRAFRAPASIAWQPIDPLAPVQTAPSAPKVTEIIPAELPNNPVAIQHTTINPVEEQRWQRPRSTPIHPQPTEAVILPFPTRDNTASETTPPEPITQPLGDLPLAEPEQQVSEALDHNQQTNEVSSPEAITEPLAAIHPEPQDAAPNTFTEPNTLDIGSHPEHNPLLPDDDALQQTDTLELGSHPEHNPLLTETPKQGLYGLPASNADTSPKKPSKLKTLATSASELAKRLLPKRK